MVACRAYRVVTDARAAPGETHFFCWKPAVMASVPNTPASPVVAKR